MSQARQRMPWEHQPRPSPATPSQSSGEPWLPHRPQSGSWNRMGIVRQIKNVTGGYSSSQVKVRNATANDDERPPRSLLQDLSDLTYDDHEVMLIMDMIDKRLNDKGKYWRHVFKALILLDYLVHTGSDRVVLWCRENLYIVKTLREFHHRDDSGRDVGGSIRERARVLTSLIMNVEQLERERARFAKGRRPRRYRRRPSDESDGNNNNEDDELQRALALSRKTAEEEEERRRMAGRSADDVELQRAQDMTQQNQAEMLTANFTGYDPYYFQAQQAQQEQLYLEQQAQEAALAQAQQEYLMAQQQAQQEAQLLYNMQQQQAEAEARQRAAQEAYQQQVMQQQSQTPLKTGSNNPFAAFNQAQASQSQSQPQPQSQAQPLEMTSTGSRPRLHRQSTFDKDHMDRLDQILSLEAPMDTFGNTGISKMPAHHKTGEFVDSSGRGLTAMLTARKTGEGTNNPFTSSQQTQYTGLASTQMQPAHTGYGFGNANHSSANLIDL